MGTTTTRTGGMDPRFLLFGADPVTDGGKVEVERDAAASELRRQLKHYFDTSCRLEQTLDVPADGFGVDALVQGRATATTAAEAETTTADDLALVWKQIEYRNRQWERWWRGRVGKTRMGGSGRGGHGGGGGGGGDDVDEIERRSESRGSDEESEVESMSQDGLELIGHQDGTPVDEDEDEDEDDVFASDSIEDDRSDDDLFEDSQRAARRPMKSQAKGEPARHATLDDDFFSIDQFNKETLEDERQIKGVSMDDGDEYEDEEGDEDDEEDEEAMADAAEMMYSDFFDPPRRAERRKAEERSKLKPIKDNDGRIEDDETGASEMDDDLDADGDIGADSDEDVDAVMKSLQKDLHDETPASTKANLSTHERRLAQLAEEIARLESENVAPKKSWTTRGEIGSKARPLNSLLEADLDFEQSKKLAPVITEEHVADLEERIRRRILEERFDDVERKRTFDRQSTYRASKALGLDQEKSEQGLAELYAEDQLAQAATGNAMMTAREVAADANLQAQHDEISQLWQDLVHDLDALSNFHYTPKRVQPSITKLPQVSTVVMESALPTAQSVSSTLAPQDVFDAKTSNRGGVAIAMSKTEQTPEDKRARRRREKRANKKQRQAIESAQKKYQPASTPSSRSVKADKATASSQLEGKRGVRVIGSKRQERDAKPQVEGHRLKL